jgi:hypothetical protein
LLWITCSENEVGFHIQVEEKVNMNLSIIGGANPGRRAAATNRHHGNRKDCITTRKKMATIEPPIPDSGVADLASATCSSTTKTVDIARSISSSPKHTAHEQLEFQIQQRYWKNLKTERNGCMI